jgi:GTP-binding protein
MNLNIHNAEFLTSVATLSQLPEETLPEIALAGRSNVGKSSLINRMLGRKSIAKTSGTPGKTQMLNYYNIDSQIYFVDCPGYGYAKVSHEQRRQFGNLIERYMVKREKLCLVLQLIDLRHEPSKEDVSMFSWLIHNGMNVCIVGTKADKIPRSQYQKQLKMIRNGLHVPEHIPIVLFSSVTSQGKDELWRFIEQTVQLQEEQLVSD